MPSSNEIEIKNISYHSSFLHLLLASSELLEQIVPASAHPYDTSGLCAFLAEVKIEEEEDIESDDAEDQDNVSEELLGIEEVCLLLEDPVVFGQSGDVDEVTEEVECPDEEADAHSSDQRGSQLIEEEADNVP